MQTCFIIWNANNVYCMGCNMFLLYGFPNVYCMTCQRCFLLCGLPNVLLYWFLFVLLYGLPNVFIIWFAKWFCYMEWPEHENIRNDPKPISNQKGGLCPFTITYCLRPFWPVHIIKSFGNPYTPPLDKKSDLPTRLSSNFLIPVIFGLLCFSRAVFETLG